MDQKPVIGGGFRQSILADRAQHENRIVPGALPPVAIEPPEQVHGLVVPCPAKGIGELSQAFECRRKKGDDFNRADRFHGGYLGVTTVIEDSSTFRASWCVLPAVG